MAGEFASPVAKKDPSLSTQEFGVTMGKIASIDTEKNRFVMKKSFDDGSEIDKTLLAMQNEVLPTVSTSLINIDYAIVAYVIHESTFGTGQEIPPIEFPLILARDPEGPIDMGTDGMVAA